MNTFTKKNIEFNSSGLKCRGWIYIPDNISKGSKLPAIVMAHGMAAVKEMGLNGYAELFAKAGFIILVFDYRFWGESDGEPRNQIFPLEMVADYRNAITWVAELSEVNPTRIGVWGSSYSGGLAISVGTFDKRVKAVVAQVPSTLNPDSRRAKDPKTWDTIGEILIQDRIERYKTGKINYIKVVAPDGESCVLPYKDAYEWYNRFREFAPTWQNKITLESLEKMREFDPVSMIHMVSPAALLLIPSDRDELIPIHFVKEAFEKARAPKDMKIISTSHFTPYEEPWLSKTAGLAIGWFSKYL